MGEKGETPWTSLVMYKFILIQYGDAAAAAAPFEILSYIYNYNMDPLKSRIYKYMDNFKRNEKGIFLYISCWFPTFQQVF